MNYDILGARVVTNAVLCKHACKNLIIVSLWLQACMQRDLKFNYCFALAASVHFKCFNTHLAFASFALAHLAAGVQRVNQVIRNRKSSMCACVNGIFCQFCTTQCNLEDGKKVSRMRQ